MCEHHQGHEHGGEHGEGRRGPGRGFRGFGRRGGFPSREQWLEHLQAYRTRLQENLRNVEDLIQRLDDRPAPAPEA